MMVLNISYPASYLLLAAYPLPRLTRLTLVFDFPILLFLHALAIYA